MPSGPRGIASGPRTPYTAPAWQLGTHCLVPRRHPLVMGIVNLTPDSFYPGSRRTDAGEAVAAALQMVAEGADLLDLGGESTRPGSLPVGAEEEWRRLQPVILELRRRSAVPITVDTCHAATARRALDAGADGINDISAARADPAMLTLAAERGCGLVLMHMLGTPRTMQQDPRYDDVVATVTDFLSTRCAAAQAAGVEDTRLMVDPGVGFGKLLSHNLLLLANLERIAGGRPLLVGASRKSFIEPLTGAKVEQRLPGSLAALAAAFWGRAAAVRVHDVAASVQFLRTLAAIWDAGDAKHR